MILVYIWERLSAGGEAGRRAVERILGGEYTAEFWSLVIAAGLVIPFLLNVYERRAQLRPTIIAPVLLLIGGFSLRYILLLAGQ
jgi:formate-dependent nitrite reductase membrane component NrfD